MPTSKPWYSSLTIWATNVVIALQALPGIITWLDASYSLHLATNPIVISVLSIIAAIVAIYGRFTANSQLTATKQ